MWGPAVNQQMTHLEIGPSDLHAPVQWVGWFEEDIWTCLNLHPKSFLNLTDLEISELHRSLLQHSILPAQQIQWVELLKALTIWEKLQHFQDSVSASQEIFKSLSAVVEVSHFLQAWKVFRFNDQCDSQVSPGHTRQLCHLAYKWVITARHTLGTVESNWHTQVITFPSDAVSTL